MPSDRELRILDEAVAEVTRTFEHRHPGVGIACDTCRDPACCEDLVIASADEADRIVSALGKSTGRVRRRIARWRGAGMDEVAREAIGSWPNVDAAPYRRRGHPCVFLVDGRCAIYEVRPRACRTHVAVGAPEQCRLFADDDAPATLTLAGAAIELVESAKGSGALVKWVLAERGALPEMIDRALRQRGR